MKVTQDSYDFAQIILKNYRGSLPKKCKSKDNNECQHDKEKMEENEEKEVKLKIQKDDIKQKYSLDYSKFEEVKEEKSEEEKLKELYGDNPYLKSMGCSHDRRKERELFEKSTEEKLENCAIFRQEGNECMKNKEYDKASFFYQKAIVTFDYTFAEGEEQEKQYDKLRELTFQNMAICKYNQDQLQDSYNFCRMALEINKNNDKCLYKRAQIQLKQDKFEECQQTIDKLFALDQKHSAGLTLQKQLIEKKKNYKISSKDVYGNMFNSNNKEKKEEVINQ